MKKKYSKGLYLFFVIVLLIITVFTLSACSKNVDSNAKIVINNIDNGNVEFEKKEYKLGDEVLLKIKPNEGYKIKSNSLVINGKIVKGSPSELKIKLNSQNTEIKCQFEQIKYNIVLKDIKNGTVIIDKNLAVQGEKVKVNIKPFIGYKYDVNDIEIYDRFDNKIELINNEFIMPNSDVTIIVNFTKEEEYDITFNEFVGGKISSNKTTAKEGEIVELEIVEDIGYEFALDSLYYVLEDNPLKKHIIENNIFIMPKGNVKIFASFNIKEEQKYSISTNAVGGTIQLNKENASCGEKISVVCSADLGFQIQRMYYSYIDNGQVKEIDITDNQFIMPNKDIVVVCEFERKFYDITVKNLVNGKIDICKKAKYQDEIIINILPNNGYKIKEDTLKVNGIVITECKFIMPSEDVSVECEFELIPSSEFKISCTNVNGIILAPSTAKYNDIVKLEVIANKGYKYVENSLKVNNEIIKNMQFIMPNHEVQIECKFEKVGYNVSFTTNNGTIEMENDKYYFGDLVTLNIVPNIGYKLVEGSLMANGKKIANTFEMPNENVIVTCQFEPIEYQITVKNIENGRIILKNLTAHYNDKVLIELKANVGSKYVENSLTINGQVLESQSFTMPNKNVELDCRFEKIDYQIITKATNGQINVVEKSHYGSKVTFEINANTGYMLMVNSVMLNGEKLNQMEFIMPSQDVVLSCEFEKITYLINDISDEINKGKYVINNSCIQLGDKLSITNNFPVGLDLVISVNGVKIDNLIINEEILRLSINNSLDISITTEDNRVIGEKYNPGLYQNGTYKVNWNVKEILSSNAFDMGSKKIAQYCYFDIELLVSNDKAKVTFFIKEDVMDWLDIEGIKGIKGEVFTKDGLTYVPYYAEIDLAKVIDGVIEIHGYVPKAPFEKFRHVKFTIDLDLVNAVLIKK